ncbi:flavodoxin family protein [Clostridium sp. Mt-5]|uniref:Flavodoxin family protein n=1 Tax=Clostridium moutaii TaxID=3240932 RepID=A0ABV4BW93_9CLOT
MTDILKQIFDADVIVLATSVYFYSIDGQMETPIDRTLPRYTEIKDKDFYFIAIATASKGAMERTIDGLRGFTDCLPGRGLCKIIYGADAWQIGDIKGSKAMREAHETGKNESFI